MVCPYNGSIYYIYISTVSVTGLNKAKNFAMDSDDDNNAVDVLLQSHPALLMVEDSGRVCIVLSLFLYVYLIFSY